MGVAQAVAAPTALAGRPAPAEASCRPTPCWQQSLTLRTACQRAPLAPAPIAVWVGCAQLAATAGTPLSRTVQWAPAAQVRHSRLPLQALQAGLGDGSARPATYFFQHTCGQGQACGESSCLQSASVVEMVRITSVRTPLSAWLRLSIDCQPGRLVYELHVAAYDACFPEVVSKHIQMCAQGSQRCRMAGQTSLPSCIPRAMRQTVLPRPHWAHVRGLGGCAAKAPAGTPTSGKQVSTAESLEGAVLCVHTSGPAVMAAARWQLSMRRQWQLSGILRATSACSHSSSCPGVVFLCGGAARYTTLPVSGRRRHSIGSKPSVQQAVPSALMPGKGNLYRKTSSELYGI